MEDAMENLLVGKDDAGEDQEQWNTRLRPPEHDDSQDEGDGQSEMENGAYHFSCFSIKSKMFWNSSFGVTGRFSIH